MVVPSTALVLVETGEQSKSHYSRLKRAPSVGFVGNHKKSRYGVGRRTMRLIVAELRAL